jgi:hypothetical protein
MAHVEVVTAFAAFTGLVLAWLTVPGSVQRARRSAEPASALERIAA